MRSGNKSQNIAIPNDFHQFYIVTRYELLKYLRGKRLLIILIILGIVACLNLLLPPALGHDYPTDALKFANSFIGFSSILIILCATFFGSDSIVSEFQHRTGYILFPNPIRKRIILYGKWSASVLASLFIMAIYYGITVASVGIIVRSLPKELVLSFGFVCFYLISAISIAFLISSLMKGATGSAVLTFFLFFMIIPIIESVMSFTAFKPWFLITFSSGIITRILTIPYPHDTMMEVPLNSGTMSLHIYIPEIWISLMVMTVYAIVAFIITILVFERKEMV